LIECWVVGAFAWFALGVVAVRLAPAPVTERSALRKIAIALGVAVLVVMPIATAFSDTFDHDDPRLFTAVGKLAHDAAPQLSAGTKYRLDLQSDTGVLGPTTDYGLVRELIRRGRNVGVGSGDIYLSRSHAAPPNAQTLLLAVGKDAMASPPANGKLLARATAAPPSNLAQVDENLRRSLSNRAVLSAYGRSAVDTNPTLAQLFDAHTDPIALVQDGTVGRLWEAGLLRSDLFTTTPFRAYTQAHLVANDYTFALYLLPK
jgi:hypothetical protein